MHSVLGGIVALVMVGCGAETTTTGGERIESAACDHRYASVTSSPGGAGGTITTVDVRAELPVEFAPTELWRVTAIACDLVTSPNDIECPTGTQCQPRPRPRCVSVPVGLTDDGLLTVSCGQETLRRDNEGTQIDLRRLHYLNATFRIQQ